MKKITKIPKMLLLTLLLFPFLGSAQNPYENILIMHNAVGLTNSLVVIDVGLTNYDLIRNIMFDVPLPPGFTYVAGSVVLNPARRVDHMINSAVLPGTNTLRIISLTITNSNFIGNSGIVLSYSLNTPAQTGNYVLNFENAHASWGFGSGCTFNPATVNGTVTITQNIQFFAGDSNCNGCVNVMDVITTVQYMLGNNPQPFCFDNADVNGDGTVNVIDVVGTVNIIISR